MRVGNIALLISLFFLIISCSEEKIITELSPDKNILVATHDGSVAKLSRLTFPNGEVIKNDVFMEANGKQISNNKITQLASYLQNIYVVIPEDYKLMVLDRTTFKSITEFTFKEENKMPRKVVFANATEAYLIFDDFDQVYLIDTYYNKIARKIKLEGNASDILAVGNQIYITVPLKNQLSIFDTRTHKIENNIQIDNVPYLVQKSADGSSIIVICAGIGKVPGDFREAISQPSVVALDFKTNAILSTNEIKPPKADLLKEYPKMFIITNNDWGFFATQKYLIRIDAKQPQFSIMIEEVGYSELLHNNIYNEFYLLLNLTNQSIIHQVDPVLAKKKEKLSFNQFVTFFTLL